MSINLKTDFESVGRGITIASGWVVVGNENLWVSFMAGSEGKGQRRKWWVTACHYTGSGSPIRVTAHRRDCFRYEAAEQALGELIPFLSQVAA